MVGIRVFDFIVVDCNVVCLLILNFFDCMIVSVRV